MKYYRIKRHNGYVCGFSDEHICVQSSKEGKLFTKRAMDKFIKEHTGAGFGFNIEDCTIEEVCTL